MRCVVAYESMYGNTRAIAMAIAEGIRTVATADVLPVSQLRDLNGAGLLVLGAPTHARGMPRPSSRSNAVATVAKRGEHLRAEPEAEAAGVREWLDQARIERHRSGGIERLPVAAFATHYALPLNVGGSAAKPIARRLKRAGGELVDRPMSFRVVTGDVLAPGETARARSWGESLARHVTTRRPGRSESRA